MAATISGYASPPDPSNLIAVADSAAHLVGGEEPLRAEVLRIARFLSAPPNFGHYVIAELLCEGAIDCILLWNWDDCVERVPVFPERLQAAHSLEDIRNLEQPTIAKIHGCATRPSTLLVTSADLSTPPVWTDDTFANRIRDKTVVFVGVGDIADYARQRLEELHQRFPDLDVWVVSPGIVAEWEQSQWADLFPDLAPERKIAMTADEFLDELGRRWTRSLIDALDQAVTGVVRQEVATELDRVVVAIGALGGPAFIRWFRSAASGSRVGFSTLSWSESLELLLGLAVIAAERQVSTIRGRSQSALMLDGDRLETLIVRGVQGAASVREFARRRAETLAGQGTIGSEATFLVSGRIVGDLHPSAESELDVASVRPASDDIFDSSETVALRFLSAGDAASRAA